MTHRWDPNRCYHSGLEYLFGGVLPPFKSTISIFYSPSQQGRIVERRCPRKHNKYIMIITTAIIYHHHVVLVARISPTLSRHSSLSFIALGRSSGQHPVSSHSCWMYVCAGCPAFAWPCVGVHKSTSLIIYTTQLATNKFLLQGSEF